MKKRFTETSKWSDPWFMELPAQWKLLWLYILDNCDNAGVWPPNHRLAAYQIGVDYEPEEALSALTGRVDVMNNGKWWVRRFVEYQYGQLSEKCPPHRQVIALVESHGLERVTKGLQKGINTLQYKYKDKDKDKEEETPKSKGTLSELKSYAVERGLPESDGEWFYNSMEAGGWTRGNKPLKDWKAHFRSYAQQGWLPSAKTVTKSKGFKTEDFTL